MRKTVCLLAAVVALTPVAVLAAEKGDQDEMCPVVGRIAARTMQARQIGAPMSEVMGIANANQTEAREMLRSMVKSAYAKPRYSTKEFQTKAVEDFRNEMEARCYAL